MSLVPLADVSSWEECTQRTVRNRLRRGQYRKIWDGGWLDRYHKRWCVPLQDLSEAAQARWREEHPRQDEGMSAPEPAIEDVVIARARAREGDGAQIAHPTEDGAQIAHPTEAAICAGIPVTPDGLPDLAAMRAQGLGEQADRWETRMRAVARLEVELKRVDFGAIQAAWQRVAREFGVSTRTLRRWKERLDEGGPVALVTPPNSARGLSRAIPDELGRKILEAYLAGARWTAAQIWRYVVRPHYQDAEQVPDITTIRTYIRERVLPLVEVYFREGKKAYQARCHPRVRRGLPDQVNEVWCADHRLLDIFVLDAGRPVRPWLTAIIDVLSTTQVGWRLCRQPSARSVAHAMRSALLTYGIPEIYVRDNGKEFLANRVGGRPERLRNPRRSDTEGADRWPACLPHRAQHSGVWNQLGTRVVTSIPYHAWSKPIEPYFGAWSRLFENLCPGHAGRNAQQKPEKLIEELDHDALLTWEEFQFWYAARVSEMETHHMVGDRDRPAADYWQDYTPRIPDPRTVGFLLQQREQVKIKTTGITLRKRRFYAPNLALYVGATVQVAYDPEEDWITVYTPDGRTLSVQEALPAQWGDWGDANRETQRGARLQRQFLAMYWGEIEGSMTPEEADPTGAYRMIALRKEREARLAEKAERLALPAADEAAADQTEAAEKTESEQDKGPELSDAYRAIRDVI